MLTRFNLSKFLLRLVIVFLRAKNMTAMYAVTAQEPTAVTLSCAGNFTDPKRVNLLTAKTSLIEVHTVAPEGSCCFALN